MTNDADMHPVRIPGYHDGPFGLRPELLEEELFWMGHLYSCATGGAGGLLFGHGYDWAKHRSYRQRLWQRADWPAFTIALPAGHRLHVVHRTVPDEAGIDYLVHHPDWERAEVLARIDGHFMSPGLSWPELIAAADHGPPAGGTVADPHARLLLLLPAFGDAATPPQAVDRLAAALRARLRMQAAEPLAAALLEGQGLAGPVRWTTTEDGARVNDGRYSFRNPTNDFALPGDRLARVSTSLAGRSDGA
ncbi:hypothetical protein ACFVUY_39500 [Kitasatospora sp. NPDC058063]|uniref:hypothetical protein n=1 Tax=unclassified Kitasatospora TaxID=2633591 RepID=UPI0036D8CA4B